MHDLKIHIDAEGNISIEVVGAPGASCEGLTAELIEALGLKQTTERTADFYQETTAPTTIVVQKGS